MSKPSKRAKARKPIANAKSELLDKRIEIALVLLFVLIFLYVKVALYTGREYPTHPKNFGAGDAYFHATVADYVKDVGNYRYSPWYIYAGYKDVVGFVPPLMYHVTAMFSHLTNVPTFFTIFLLSGVFFLIGTLIFYLFIKRYNPLIALLSLPLMLDLVYRIPFEIILTWGKFLGMPAFMFMMSIVWLTPDLEKRGYYILLGIFLIGGALTHLPELIWAVGFIAVYIAYVLINEKTIDKNILKNLAIGAVALLIFTIYWLVLFKYTFGASEHAKLRITDNSGWYPDAHLNNFTPIEIMLLLMGVLYAAFQIVKIREPKRIAPFLAAGFLFLTGFTNYVGVWLRSFESRMLWPVYGSVFIASAAYVLISSVKKEYQSKLALAAMLGLLFFAANSHGSSLNYLKDERYESLTRDTWDAFMWIKENTPQDSKVYYFYRNPAIMEDLLWNMGRTVYVIFERGQFSIHPPETPSFTRSLEELFQTNQFSIHREYLSTMPADVDYKLPYRKSLLSFGYHFIDDNLSRYNPSWKNPALTSMVDICGMDYLMFNIDDKSVYGYMSQDAHLLMRAKVFISTSMRNRLLKKPWFKEVYSNSEISILHNGKPGEECVK